MSNLRKINDEDIKKFAKELEETNTMIWNAICYTSELLNSDVYKKYKHTIDEEESIDFLKRIAKFYKNIEHNDDKFAEPESNGSNFEDYEYFTKNLEKILNEMD